MFDIQMELEILQGRLQDVLSLDCLDSESLASAYVDQGYINCAVQYNVKVPMEMYEDLLGSINHYEEQSC